MKTILMLIVGLMLAGCGSMENHVRNRHESGHHLPLCRDGCGGHDMRLPLTIKPWRCLNLPTQRAT
jgi:hypothetical protein